ncbi:DNA gyrase inhibitor YacG [Caldimonas thermodepolymerans]|uniref:DNA gyrase inhibitor YacG n=1 Tax=Caldimonas thermodepolymerans TaxID=215580 RepID=A0A2S5T295_9BURK|nr:DNA gyrase inhibitor YacG [Caldimonas thermodepolymerans]PPE69008.1 DNA gyrase inhibitor YacG [Caldimonas thermodepolymerans]QPC32308.1 DNA gyrase inhibitor YacG [Caldimonas thermodepolymerans]RDH98204.1 hypothetical protein DES46_107204 [Caldimonas thermodepolymerans]
MNQPSGPTVRCPTCGSEHVYSTANPYRPFCSERCKNIDLGAWASESYRVPAPPDAQANPDDPNGPH